MAINSISKIILLLTISHNEQADERLYSSSASFYSPPEASLWPFAHVQPRIERLQYLSTDSLYLSRLSRLARYPLSLPSLGKWYRDSQKRLPPLSKRLKRLRWREFINYINNIFSISAYLLSCSDCRPSRHCLVIILSRVQSLYSSALSCLYGCIGLAYQFAVPARLRGFDEYNFFEFDTYKSFVRDMAGGRPLRSTIISNSDVWNTSLELFLSTSWSAQFHPLRLR